MNPAIVRLLDANFNRSREGLRVIEDYARFILNDGNLSESLKGLRHDLALITSEVARNAILYRDIAGDVGREIKTPDELTRGSAVAVVIASGKRVGESLRTIEEYLKIDHPELAGQVEAMRYRFYAIEQNLTARLNPSKRFIGVRLYVLITERVCRKPWLEAAQEAIAGGAECLQLREKEIESGELLRRARLLVSLCRKHGALSIINDRADIAMLADADGVHVGQTDLSVRDVRSIVGPDKIIGVSTHRLEQARQAERDGADYIGVGPIYLSGTKPRAHIAGLEYARQVAEEIRIPAVAIAGINAENVHEVRSTGLCAIAVTAAVLDTVDVAKSTRLLRLKLDASSNVSIGL